MLNACGKLRKTLYAFSGLKDTAKQCTDSSHLCMEISTYEKLIKNIQETKLKLVR